MSNNQYSLIDSGRGFKLEKFGPYLIKRPAAQAVWLPQLSEKEWLAADAQFTREPENLWKNRVKLPEQWTISVSSINFKISPTDFGHLGIFPEQAEFWAWIQTAISHAIKEGRQEVNVLNLFAYSGGVTLSAAKAGAKVCHLDASKGMVAWARDNAALNNLQEAPIRWIIDDVAKFLKRELRRGQKYDAIILDPPTFGRGSKGEVFKIEESLTYLLEDCYGLLSDNPLFVLLSCHTPGFTPLVLNHLLLQMMKDKKGRVDSGEMSLKGDKALELPSGTFARWRSMECV